MGLTVAPGLTPLPFPLSMLNTTATGQFGSLSHMVLSFFSLSFSTTSSWMGVGFASVKRGFSTGEGGE
jgi:hypothetical protein